MDVLPNPLNYHHLYYFWAIATDGQLTRAAKRLRVSPSALSTQLRQLEEHLGQALFDRRGRGLELTEAGRIALVHARAIFEAGDQLLATLRRGHADARVPLRIGAVATLSRNFQRGFLSPLMGRDDVALQLMSGSLTELLDRLRAHTLDVVLCNQRVEADDHTAWRCVRLAEQRVSVVGPPEAAPLQLPDGLGAWPLVLPSRGSELRAQFDLYCASAGLQPQVIAEVDDMAMLRLLARDSRALSIVPPIVVVDELRRGRLVALADLPELSEVFYAVCVDRLVPHPWLERLMTQPEPTFLGRDAVG